MKVIMYLYYFLPCRALNGIGSMEGGQEPTEREREIEELSRESVCVCVCVCVCRRR